MLTKQFNHVFHGVVGSEEAISDYCEHQHFKQRSNTNCNNFDREALL
jgi:hypothetical protein